MEQRIKASNIIGMNIGRFRIRQKLTQDELAAEMQRMGCDISRGTLAKLEAGIRHISVDELEALKIILHMEYGDFFSM